MLQIAMQLERLTRGRMNVFATQATMTWYAQTAPRGMRNIAKKRAPVEYVPVATALPTAEIRVNTMM